MKTEQITALTLLLLLSTAFTADVALADGNRWRSAFSAEEFDGYIHFCAESFTDFEEVSSEGILTLIARNLGNIWATGNPLIDGREENRVVATIDLIAGIGEGRIRGKLEPTAVDGRWYFQQHLMINFAEGDSSRGIGFGTGDLQGKVMFFNTGSFVAVPESPCPMAPSTPIEGKIVSFGWSF